MHGQLKKLWDFGEDASSVSAAETEKTHSGAVQDIDNPAAAQTLVLLLAENRELRDRAVDLALEVQTLRERRLK